jgi:hypothetical protein
MILKDSVSGAVFFLFTIAMKFSGLRLVQIDCKHLKNIEDYYIFTD